jgi:hypothetical protein
LLMQAFDVCISSSGSGGSSSSSRVAIIDCMCARCCSPCVSLCPHIQVRPCLSVFPLLQRV